MDTAQRYRHLAAGSFTLLIALFAYVGCSPPDQVAENEQEEAQVFDVTGTITEIPTDGRTLVINHTEIPGFMAAMTMPFHLADESLTDGLAAGDPVRFRYVVDDRRSRIDKIDKIDVAELQQSRRLSAAPHRQGLFVPRLEPGDPVPGFELVNQDGEAFSVSDFRGKALLVTFIFTRCPVQDFCPRMSSQFQEVQKLASGEEDLRDRFHLLSVTIDPEVDTPEVLDKYASRLTDDRSSWTFATAAPDRIEEMTTRFSVYAENNPESPTIIDHTLATALVGPDGKLVHIWRGNAWKPDEVIAAIRSSTAKKN